MWRPPALLALVFGARVGETMQFNNTSVFAPHYATLHLRISPSVFLGAITIANLVSLVLIPAFGGLSDKVGRRPIAILGGISVAYQLGTVAGAITAAISTVGVNAVAIYLVAAGALITPETAPRR
jgi:MFS family permease